MPLDENDDKCGMKLLIIFRDQRTIIPNAHV